MIEFKYKNKKITLFQKPFLLEQDTVDIFDEETDNTFKVFRIRLECGIQHYYDFEFMTKKEADIFATDLIEKINTIFLTR
jgi:hypothetical protein